MYRERDYNRQPQDPDAEYFGESHRKPKVVKGDSVFGESRPPKKPRRERYYDDTDGYEPYEESYEPLEEQRGYYEEPSEPRFDPKPEKKRRRRKKRPLLILLLLIAALFLGFWFYLTVNLNSHPLPRDD
ncbi:MAG: hypothetical protein IIY02_07130, partial [Firmicutes bacterium]|nr:hypothetical protein [Bacillota bacterium]